MAKGFNARGMKGMGGGMNMNMLRQAQKMQEQMQKYALPLCALESGDPVGDFDIVAFTLQYEMCYTTVLNMLSLAGIPLLASARGEDAPIIIGGGHCAYNPEPIADFFDIFSIGEGRKLCPSLRGCTSR